jgi:hypothetical protein
MLYFGGACGMVAASLLSRSIRIKNSIRNLAHGTQIITHRVGEIFALIGSPFKGAPTAIAAIAITSYIGKRCVTDWQEQPT